MSVNRKISADELESGIRSLADANKQAAIAHLLLGKGQPVYLGWGRYLPGSEDGPHSPMLLKPENLEKGTVAATRMLNSDLLLQQKFAAQSGKQEVWEPVSAPNPICTADDPTGSDVFEAVEFAQGRETNIVLPPPKEKQDKEDDIKFELSAQGRELKDVGSKVEAQRNIREHFPSRYTYRNTNGTFAVDNDLKGKWSDEVSLVKAGVEKKLFDDAVASGKFGGKDTLFSGEGKVFGASAKGGVAGEWTSKALKAQAAAEAKASFLEGAVKSNEDYLVSGKLEGSAVGAKAEAKAELVMEADRATAEAKVGAGVHLMEAALEGKLSITPKRVVDPVISVWNYVTEDDVEPLHECWDIGITGDAKASGQVGLGAEAGASIGHLRGNIRGELGAKASALVGGGAKIGIGTTGFDKFYDGTCPTPFKLW